MERGTNGSSCRGPGKEELMPILLWLLGVPIPIIIILVLLSHH
jgi:hypothetical protein